MEQTVDVTQTISQMLRHYPRMGYYLKKHGINYSLCGHDTLAHVMSSFQLDAESTLSELNKLIHKEQGAIDWENQSLHALVSYIIDAHHSYLYMVLPQLHRMLQENEESCHVNQEAIAFLFSIVKTELEQHIVIEEEVIFPKIVAYEKSPTLHALIDLSEYITDLHHEHHHISSLMQDLRELTNDFLITNEQGIVTQQSYIKLDELETDLMEHFYLENYVLFPRVLQALQSLSK
ncbi:ScdA protein [Fictibacillus macauensis ZFHKF-1]|uniref:ScdA protein n=1 Tax=Fictibacillus macauensis ZFHKF-1 TaxID=1196324 RepID=I8AKV1_9BACL|nr:hemerythrin domain-containing protein [Fictibacillus macauensis]EIT86452.1 ScdA protein [Fictibacillus macauensis ZFHKF-1]